MRLKAADLAATRRVASAQMRAHARFEATHPRLYQEFSRLADFNKFQLISANFSHPGFFLLI